jgi:hypothetical protein
MAIDHKSKKWILACIAVLLLVFLIDYLMATLKHGVH